MSLFFPQPQITIKPAKEEKNKPAKKEEPVGISVDELKEKVPQLLDDFFNTEDTAPTLTAIKDLKVPKKLTAQLITQILVNAVSRTGEHTVFSVIDFKFTYNYEKYEGLYFTLLALILFIY